MHNLCFEIMQQEVWHRWWGCFSNFPTNVVPSDCSLAKFFFFFSLISFVLSIADISSLHSKESPKRFAWTQSDGRACSTYVAKRAKKNLRSHRERARQQPRHHLRRIRKPRSRSTKELRGYAQPQFQNIPKPLKHCQAFGHCRHIRDQASYHSNASNDLLF